MERFSANERVQDFLRGLILALVNLACFGAIIRVLCR